MQHLIYLKRSNPYLKGILRCNSSDILKILANKKLESTKINKRYLTEYRTNTRFLDQLKKVIAIRNRLLTVIK